MASLITKITFDFGRNIKLKCGQFGLITRNSSKLPKTKTERGTIKHRNLISSTCESLAARGFLRSWAPYTPPADVEEKLNSICQNVLGSDYDSNQTFTSESKFSLLNTCFKEIGYSIPNSMLYQIETPNDVIEFYKTPISTTTPYDELKNKDLPPNVHVQYEYIRFNPETDKLFNGLSPYPESSTVVTGLKYKDKYKGHKAKSPFYYYNEANYIKGKS